MKKTYVLKPFKQLPHDHPARIADEEKRRKVEEAMGRKMTDFDWIEYKRMVLKP